VEPIVDFDRLEYLFLINNESGVIPDNAAAPAAAPR